MTHLSRRSLLTGLLSSAAVIAAGPVAKVAAPLREIVGGNQALERHFLEYMSQSIAQTFWYGNSEISPMQFAGFTPFYNSSVDGALALIPNDFLDDLPFKEISGGDVLLRPRPPLPDCTWRSV